MNSTVRINLKTGQIVSAAYDQKTGDSLLSTDGQELRAIVDGQNMPVNGFRPYIDHFSRGDELQVRKNYETFVRLYKGPAP